MLQLLQPGNKRFWFIAFSLALLVNISLAGLIYGLTIGTNETNVNKPITIDFRQFTDSTVKEEEYTPELEVTPEPMQEMTAIPQPALPTFDVQNISLNSNINLPAVSVPTFDIAPQLVDFTANIQPKINTAPTVVNNLQKTLPVAEPAIEVAKVLHRSNPQYPYKAKRLKIEGYVVLHILIDDTGRSQKVNIIEEKPRGYFAKTSRKAVSRWKFEKAPAGTEVWKKWRMVFELN